jgi:hypothetical protein
MFRILKTAICAGLAVATLQEASGFSLFGPAEAYQIPTLDYVTRFYYGDTELGGPKNFGEGSRLNVPIITYAFDSTFLTYFGSQGVAAVDSAMAVMNGLPTASRPNLPNFLMQGNDVVNYTAAALTLTDLKSCVMGIMLEHMGLIGETHVWDLRTRAPEPGTCQFEYLVVNRNYDPITYDPTPYVNGVQYTYGIWDGCPSAISVADAIEETTDQTSTAQYAFTAVATLNGLVPGLFYLRITRDDMGGLAYLYRNNNYAYETLDSNSIVSSYVTSPYVPVTGFTNGVTNGFQGLLGGVEKISYVKVAYDSLLGTAFTPRSYTYSLPYVTNSSLRSLRVTRTITQPDIIFTAGDLVTGPTTFPVIVNAYTRGFNYISNGVVTVGADGITSQVISAQEIVTFNNINAIYVNFNPSFMDQVESVGYPYLLWGSFDGTTNAPVVFPNGTSIATLEQQVLEGGPSIPLGLYNPISFTTNSTTTTTTGATTP